MATFLDLGLIKGFSFIFPFLLVWTVVFALLEHRSVFGDRKQIHAVMAFVIAMMVALTRPAVEVISIMTPWFVVLLMVLLLMILFFKFFGVTDEDIVKVFKDPYYVWIGWVLGIVSLAIFAGAVLTVFKGTFTAVWTGGEIAVPSGTALGGLGEEEALRTVFHPKILGLIFIFVVAALTVNLLTAGAPPTAPKGK